MDKEYLLTPRSDLRMQHYESVVEQDHRLQLIGNPIFVDLDIIVILDEGVANGNKTVKSHPMAIYLNKSAIRSKQPAGVNKNLIYERMKYFHISDEMKQMSMSTNYAEKVIMLKKQDNVIDMMNARKIDLRERWKKLYDRNPPFEAVRELLSAEISNKVTQLQTIRPVMKPVKYRNVDTLLRKYETVSRTLIYRRCQLKSQHGEGCFPLTWIKPESSNIIDEVSGENLSHITLLCRDVICECNTCTTGCTTAICTELDSSCQTCSLNLFTETIVNLTHQYCGSFAENCMLPIFYIHTDGNLSVKKRSDIDIMMAQPRGKVGFDVTESNIFARIDTGISRPGFLRLRDLESGGWLVLNHSDFENSRLYSEFLHPDVLHSTQQGPASSTKMNGLNLNDVDRVPYFSCSSWPPIAKSWIDRERPSNWPSKETIQTIVSKGCRIVHMRHEQMQEKQTEFRFSFSEAELILFGTLTCDQIKCFIAFKALIKYIICKFEYQTREGINSYCLKTIFLWACEEIPVDHWQTTNGWSKCLLYMIDNLFACVKARKLPGYFIPESNLLDNMKQSGPLLDEIEALRCHPISHAAIFINATKCFRGFHSKIYHHTKILCRARKVSEIVLIEQLIFLQSIVAKTNVTRGCLFWKKEAVLRIFAKWCKQNSNEIGLALWQCLTNDMALFDVVYLDIVHEFDVPNNVLLKYVDKGWSANFVCRLGSCYYNEFDQGEYRNQVKYTIRLKSLLMMQHVLDRDYPTISTMTTCIYTLIKHKEFEIAIRVLESGADEMLKSDESIWLDHLDSVVSCKTKNEFREMTDLEENSDFDMNRFRIPVRVLVLYFSYLCYKQLEYKRKLCSVFDLFSSVSYLFSHVLTKKHKIEIHLDYLLLLEVYEHLSHMFHHLYAVCILMKMETIKKVVDRHNGLYSRMNGLIRPGFPERLTGSCSVTMRSILQNYLGSLSNCPVLDDLNNELEVIMARQAKSTADRMYYAQVLIFNKQIEKAISILNSIIAAEGDYSLSVFICPKLLWESNLLDDNLRRELSESSADYVVFPTNLYARYLLVNAYNSLGQMGQCERNKTEFCKLRRRYSSVEAFAPMLNIVSNFFN